MTPEEEKIRGADAQGLLSNPLFKETFVKVGEYLEKQALSCPPDNKDMAQRIIMAKQLLASLKREITRVVENGEVAAIQIAEIEKRKGFRAFLR